MTISVDCCRCGRQDLGIGDSAIELEAMREAEGWEELPDGTWLCPECADADLTRPAAPPRPTP